MTDLTFEKVEQSWAPSRSTFLEDLKSALKAIKKQGVTMHTTPEQSGPELFRKMEIKVRLKLFQEKRIVRFFHYRFGLIDVNYGDPIPLEYREAYNLSLREVQLAIK